MANTLPGTPYVESSDLVANYPAASEDLAERIDLVGVLPFADSTARGTALPTPSDGQYSYLQDTNSTEYWNGSAWVFAGGKILQVISASKTDTFTTASTSYVDVTGLTVTITPRSTSSKILVLSDIFISNNGVSGARHTFAQIVRDSTAISVGTSVGSRVPVSAAFFSVDARLHSSASTIFLDAPASTSALVYKVQMLAGGNSAVLNRWGEDIDNNAYPRAASNITVMEVSA
jgi:hypothetical protein